MLQLPDSFRLTTRAIRALARFGLVLGVGCWVLVAWSRNAARFADHLGGGSNSKVIRRPKKKQ